MRTTSLSILALALSTLLGAQSDATPPDDAQADNAAGAGTRAEEIERSREQKSQNLAPDLGSKLERRIIRIRRSKYIEDLTSSPDGFGLAFGGLPVAQGFAAGVKYKRRDFWDGRLQLRASVRGSIRQAYLGEFTASIPNLAHDRISLELHSYHFDYPNTQYYGPGPRSSKTGRSVYRLENTGVDFKPGVRLAPGLRLGLVGSFVAVNVGPGDNYKLAPAEKLYSPAVAPGIDHQSNFLEGGGFLEFDWRNYLGEPTRGGLYRAQYTVVSDRDLHTGSFNRLDLEAQQYIPFFQDKRVIALRGKTTLTDRRRGQVVPFYLQPILGGSESLRGYRPYRFYDDNAVLLTAEYRYEVFPGLDMALFVDGGKVFHEWEQWNLHRLQSDVGFGFRFNIRNSVVLRIDTGFSHEGFQIWAKFSNVF